MKKSLTIALMTALAMPTMAFAQLEEEETPPPVEEPVYTPPPPAPEPEPVFEEEEEAEEEEGSFLDDITGNLFVDGFYHVDWNRPDPGRFGTGGGATPGNNPGHRAYEYAQGFNLAFAGLDLQYTGDNIGARFDVRMGPGAALLLTGSQATPVLSMVNQAYVTWMPTDSLTLDLGQFNTIYGAEVGDSWKNLNYGRGALYYLMQPFYHTGLRASYAVSDSLTLTGIVVNGTNNPIAFNTAPHVGAQAGITMGDAFLAAGYYTGPAGAGFFVGPGTTGTNDDWEHFFDVVFTASAGKLSFVGNVDFYVLPEIPEAGTDLQFYWGASAAVGYQIVDTFGIAARAEFLHNRENFFAVPYEQLVTGTVTLDYKPVENLIIRLDNRFEWADVDTFADDDGGARQTWFATTLGVVVTAN